jgi:hypothetical protein
MKAKLALVMFLALAGLVGGVATYAALDCSGFECGPNSCCSAYPTPSPTLSTWYR